MKLHVSGLLVVGIFGLAGTLSAATLSVQRATGRPGSLVDLEVRIADASRLGGFDVVLGYDPQAAQAVGALPGPGLEDSLFRWSEPGPGKVLVTAGDVPALEDGHALFAVTFQLYAPEEETSPVTVEMARAYRRGVPEPLVLTTEDGTLVFHSGPARWAWALAGLILAAIVFAILRAIQNRRRASQET